MLKVELCMGSSCFARGNKGILTGLEDYIMEKQLDEKIEVIGHLCMGNCSSGPVVMIDGKEYLDLDVKECLSLIDSRLNGK